MEENNPVDNSDMNEAMEVCDADEEAHKTIGIENIQETVIEEGTEMSDEMQTETNGCENYTQNQETAILLIQNGEESSKDNRKEAEDNENNTQEREIAITLIEIDGGASEENHRESDGHKNEIQDQESDFEEGDGTSEKNQINADDFQINDCVSNSDPIESPDVFGNDTDRATSVCAAENLSKHELPIQDGIEDKDPCVSTDFIQGNPPTKVARTYVDKIEGDVEQNKNDPVGDDCSKPISIKPHAEATTSSKIESSSNDGGIDPTVDQSAVLHKPNSDDIKDENSSCPLSSADTNPTSGVNTLDDVTGVQYSTTPGKPRLWQKSPLKAGIAWIEPTHNSDKVKSYKIKIKGLSDNLWNSVVIPGPPRDASHQIETELQLQPGIPYLFSIIAIYEEDAMSDDSEISDEFIIDATAEEICKAKAIEFSTIERNGNPALRQMVLERTYEKIDGTIQKFEYGVRDPASNERVIMIVGATGAGKSTLINGMVNYMFGLNWEDGERLKLIPEQLNHNQAESQTKAISSYTIHHEPGLKVPFTVTIIDTPGFGDTGGYKRDEQITEQIREFFTTAGANGIDHIDAVGFVTQSSLPRLTPTQRYIFDKILSLFGRDIEDNILMLLTFADAQKPPVLSGIKEAGFKYSDYFKFNNSAIFAEKEGHSRNEVFNKMFWEMGEESFKTFLDSIGNFESKSLTLTREVLQERHQLELYVFKMQDDVKLGLNKLENLTNELNVALRYEALIDANKEFTYTVEEDFIVKQDIPPGHYTTNCITCNRTCHESCCIPDDKDKAGCWAMTFDGTCRICPQKCPWQSHKNMPFIMVINRKRVTKTSTELYARYQQGMQDKITAEGLIQKLHEDFESHQTSTLMLTEEVRQTVEYLNDIALKPNPLSTLDYIDTLIDSEMAERKPGHKQRVEELRKLRTRTEVFVKMIDEGADPFNDYRIKIMDMKSKQTSEQGVFGRIQDFVNFSWRKVKEGLRRESKRRRSRRWKKGSSGYVRSSRV